MHKINYKFMIGSPMGQQITIFGSGFSNYPSRIQGIIIAIVLIEIILLIIVLVDGNVCNIDSSTTSQITCDVL